MADIQLPVGWKFGGSTGIDQVQFTRPGHTASLPVLAIFKRRQANGKPTSEYSISLIRAAADDQTGVVRNTIIELKIRNVKDQVDQDVKDDLAALGSLLATSGFQDDSVTELLLPYAHSILTV